MFVTDFLKKSTTSVVFNFKLKKNNNKTKKQSKTKQNKFGKEKKGCKLKKIINN